MRARAALVALVVVSIATPSLAWERPGRTWRVSVASDGTQADVNSQPPKFIPNSKGLINETGRYVTFEGWAPNLVAEDREGILRPHIYRHDLVTRETIRVTLRPDGHKSNQGGRGAEQSADGRFIAFYSASSDLTERPDTTRGTDVYVRDMVLGVTEKITVAPDGSDGSNGSPINGNNSFLNDLSPDGRYVVFYSVNTNLTEEPDANGTIGDMFMRDRVTDRTEIVSLANDGSQGDDTAGWAIVTADGSEVIFDSWAQNLVDEPVRPGQNLYVRDREQNTTEVLPIAGEGNIPNGDATVEGISHDGRFVLFNSAATNLVPYDGNAEWDAFVYDRELNRTERVSVASDGSEVALGGYGWEISPNGRYVTINSDAPDLVAGDTNGRSDAFVRDRLLGITRRISVASDGTQGNRHAYFSSTSADGSIAAFDSDATNLVQGDTNEEKDIFVRRLGPELGLGELDLDLRDDQVHASGWATFSGLVAAGASDPAGDVADPTSDLIAGSMIVRPEDESVQVRWDLQQLSATGAPGVIYGMSFDAAGASYEIRGMPTVPGVPRFDLYQCEPACVRMQELRGRYGREGSNVVVTLPNGTGPFVPGAELSDIRIYTALGEGLVAKLQELDGIDLGAAAVAKPELSFAIAPREATDVLYGSPVELQAGTFSHAIDLGGADPRTHDLAARTCLGEVCTSTVRPLATSAPTESPSSDPTTSPTSEPTEAQPVQTSVAFTDGSASSGQYSDATLFEARLTDADGSPVPNQELSFELVGADGARSFTATTNADGIASVAPTLEEKPGPRQLTVRFAGTDDLLASADTTSFIVDHEDTDLTLDVEGKGSSRTFTARLSDRDSIGGVAQRRIDFYADSELIGQATTDEDGTATLEAPPRYRGGKHDSEARFAGDSFYRRATASAAK